MPQDIARLTLAALRSDQCENRTLTFAGPSAYTTREVIEMCERMSDSTAKVTSVPTWLLRATRNILKSADWARDAADRLVSTGQGLGFWAGSRWSRVLCEVHVEFFRGVRCDGEFGLAVLYVSEGAGGGGGWVSTGVFKLGLQCVAEHRGYGCWSQRHLLLSVWSCTASKRRN